MKIGTRIEIDHKGDIQKFVVAEKTTQKELDSFYDSLKKKTPKKAK